MSLNEAFNSIKPTLIGLCRFHGPSARNNQEEYNNIYHIDHVNVSLWEIKYNIANKDNDKKLFQL